MYPSCLPNPPSSSLEDLKLHVNFEVLHCYLPSEALVKLTVQMIAIFSTISDTIIWSFLTQDSFELLKLTTLQSVIFVTF